MVSSGIASANVLAVSTNAKTSVKSKTSFKQDFASCLKSEASEHTGIQTEDIGNSNEKGLSSLKENGESKNIETADGSSETMGNNGTETTETVFQTEMDEGPELSEEAIEAANVLFTNIFQLICDYTGKNMDEINSAMQNLGLESTDLLNHDSLNNLITELMGKKNIMELLTDTDLSSMIKNLIGEINDLKHQFVDCFNLDPETVQSILEEQVQENPEIPEPTTSAGDTQQISEWINPEEMKPMQENTLQTNGLETSDMEQNESQAIESLEPGILGEGKAETSETSEGSANQDMSGLMKDEKENSENRAENVNGVAGMSDVLENIRSIVTEALPEDNKESVANRIISQIIDNIRLNARPNMTSLEMQLEPESLGKVNISVIAKAGHITAGITAQNEIAKEAIESQLNVLKENLHQQGIKVEAIEVTIASHSFEENLEKGNDSTEKQKESKSRKTISAEELAEINGDIPDTQDSMEEKVMEQMGATVSYLA